MSRYVFESYKREFIIPEVIFVRKKYGFFNFLFDILLVGITGGLWLIWIFVREMRRR